jgi:hypothetical protein
MIDKQDVSTTQGQAVFEEEWVDSQKSTANPPIGLSVTSFQPLVVPQRLGKSLKKQDIQTDVSSSLEGRILG